jgi:CRISPR-associated protein Cas1
MSWKTLFISNPCKISIEKSNLLIKTEEKKRVITIKDISTIVLETDRATITSKALSLISENNIILIGMDNCGNEALFFLQKI